MNVTQEEMWERLFAIVPWAKDAGVERFDELLRYCAEKLFMLSEVDTERARFVRQAMEELRNGPGWLEFKKKEEE